MCFIERPLVDFQVGAQPRTVAQDRCTRGNIRCVICDLWHGGDLERLLHWPSVLSLPSLVGTAPTGCMHMLAHRDPILLLQQRAGCFVFLFEQSGGIAKVACFYKSWSR